MPTPTLARRVHRKLSGARRQISAIGPRAFAAWHGPRLLAGPHLDITLSGHPLRLRRGTPDLAVALANLGGEFDALRDVLPRDFDGLIVDAGGYIGTAALALSSLYPRARVVTLEPVAESFEMLHRNTAPRPQITPLRAALVAQPDSGPVEMYDRRTGFWGMTVLPGAGRTRIGGAAAPALSLCEVRKRFGNPPIGLLKLDIEGAEHALLTTPESRNALRAIPVVAAELHDRIVPGCHAAFTDCFADRDLRHFGPEKLMSVAV